MLDLTYLPKALRWFRLDRGWKQCEVAKAASLSPSMLSGYEKGSRIPSLESLARLLGALGVSLAQLEEAMIVFRREDERRNEREGSDQRGLEAASTAGENGSGHTARPSHRPLPASDRPYRLPAQLVPASELAEPARNAAGGVTMQRSGGGFDPAASGRDPGGLQATLALLRNLQSLLEEQMAERNEP